MDSFTEFEDIMNYLDWLKIKEGMEKEKKEAKKKKRYRSPSVPIWTDDLFEDAQKYFEE